MEGLGGKPADGAHVFTSRFGGLIVSLVLGVAVFCGSFTATKRFVLMRSARGVAGG